MSATAAATAAAAAAAAAATAALFFIYTVKSAVIVNANVNSSLITAYC